MTELPPSYSELYLPGSKPTATHPKQSAVYPSHFYAAQRETPIPHDFHNPARGIPFSSQLRTYQGHSQGSSPGSAQRASSHCYNSGTEISDTYFSGGSNSFIGVIICAGISIFFFLPLGLAALIVALIAYSAFTDDDYQRAVGMTRIAMGLSMGAFVCGIILGIICVVTLNYTVF